MAGFAPAYRQESDDIWLNGVLQDIISPRRNSSMSRSRSRHTDTTGQRSSLGDGDYGIPPVVDTEGGVTRGRQPIPSHHRMVSRSPTLSNTISVSSQPDSIPPVPPPAYGQTTEASTGSLSSIRPQPWDKASTSSTVSSYPAANLPESFYIPSRPRPRPRSKIRDNQQDEVEQGADTEGSKSRAVHFDSHKTLIEPPMRRLSTVSEFSGFESHPAVRPLEPKKGLGEAAGPPAADDPTQYPGPIALALIVLGICLSVFIISLDRNIITTVSLAFLLAHLPLICCSATDFQTRPFPISPPDSIHTMRLDGTEAHIY